MARKRNRKVVKYRKPFQINIGIIVFFIIFLYLLYYIFVYFTTEHISVYEVNQGTIAQNTTLQGLILRDETIYYAEDSGYINYFCKGGTKASAGSYIYSIDKTGNFYNELMGTDNGKAFLSDELYGQLESIADEYLTDYSDVNFKEVYQFKYDMEGTLIESLNSSGKNKLSDVLGTTSGLQAHLAKAAGIVIYAIDGMEAVTLDNFSSEMFQPYSYERQNLLKNKNVSTGDAVYKLINSEFWNVILPIDESLALVLKEEEVIKVEFKKDKSQVWANASIITRNNNPYLVLEFKNSMIRFAEDRYIEVELLLADASGLKIPNSSITTKEFITVPKEYITKGGNSNDNGVFLVQKDEEGKESILFEKTTLFYETDKEYYIDSDKIELGAVILKPDSNEQYMLKETKKLEGVYNVNKGYAVFKRIERLFQNEEYTIVEDGIAYGIALYDHIALNSNAVNEDDIVH